MKRQIDLRKELARACGNARAAQRRGALTPDRLRLASATLRAACRRLLLPRFGLRERARMLAADVQGVQELMLALDQTLASFPDLAGRLCLHAGIVAELQARDVELLTALESADTITTGAGRAERAAGARLKALCALVLNTAARLHADPEDQAAADQAADLLAVVARFEQRIERTRRRRLQRLRRRELALAAGPGTALAAHEEDSAHAEDPPEPALRTEDPAEDMSPEIQGAPLGACLRAPLASFRAVNAQLTAIAESVKDEGVADEAPEDLLYYAELGALLSTTLPLLPRVQAACQVAPEDLFTLGAQADDAALLVRCCRLFARMAADGRLFVSSFTLQLYEQATAWLAGRAAATEEEDERQRLQVEALRLQQVRGRAVERQADRKARADKKVQAAKRTVRTRRPGAKVSPVLDPGGEAR